MFIGHIPGAYFAARPLRKRLGHGFLIAALLGGVLPDLDLIQFYFVDDRAYHHHEYLTHRPILWATIFGLGLVFRAFANKRICTILIGLGFGGLVHMLLDSIAGSIAWGWPLSTTAAPLVVVPATHGHWILSFANHWTFKAEVVLTILAATIALRANWQSLHALKKQYL